MPQRHDPLGDHLKPDGLGQADGLGQPRAGIAIEVVRRFARFGFDVNHERRAPARARIVAVFQVYAVSSATSCSWSWIGPIGMTVEIACL